MEAVGPGEEQTQGISHQCKTEGRVQGGQTLSLVPSDRSRGNGHERKCKMGDLSEYQQGTVRVTEHWNE